MNKTTKKITWSVVGVIGVSGLAYIILGFFIIMIVLGGLGGASKNEEKERDSAFSGNGMHSCSPTGEINQTLWDSIFNDPAQSGKLSGKGDKIIELSEEKGIDPVLFASIAFHETMWGKSNAIVEKNNPGGLMGANGLMVFDTLDEGLESMARTLYNRIIVDGLVTIEKLGAVYAPIGADNDPNDLNSNWVPVTTRIAESLGGLVMNCEVLTDFTFDFDGDVSELRANIASSGTVWLGKPYVWGGGRTPASASRGEFDCSSFVHWVYKKNGIELGNMGSVSTETLKHMGKQIPISEIKVGDLIFWDTYKVDGHVGIYIGDGKFIGSQSSTGVAIESVNSSYWSSVFKGHVRRIVED